MTVIPRESTACASGRCRISLLGSACKPRCGEPADGCFFFCLAQWEEGRREREGEGEGLGGGRMRVVGGLGGKERRGGRRTKRRETDGERTGEAEECRNNCNCCEVVCCNDVLIVEVKNMLQFRRVCVALRVILVHVTLMITRCLGVVLSFCVFFAFGVDVSLLPHRSCFRCHSDCLALLHLFPANALACRRSAGARFVEACRRRSTSLISVRA